MFVLGSLCRSNMNKYGKKRRIKRRIRRSRRRRRTSRTKRYGACNNKNRN